MAEPLAERASSSFGRADDVAVPVHPPCGARYGPCTPLHYVDPNKKRGPLYRANVRIGRTRLGRDYGLRIGWRIDPWLYRATGGRYPRILGSLAGAPLMTTGAKSGQPREVQVTYFHDGTDPILIASYGGGPKNPQWYYNSKVSRIIGFGENKEAAADAWQRVFTFFGQHLQ